MKWLIKENKTSPEEMAIVSIQLGQVVADAVNRAEVDLIVGQASRLGVVLGFVRIWHLPLPERDQMRTHLDMSKIPIIAV
jgi:hypothetical protein